MIRSINVGAYIGSHFIKTKKIYTIQLFFNIVLKMDTYIDAIPRELRVETVSKIKDADTFLKFVYTYRQILDD